MAVVVGVGGRREDVFREEISIRVGGRLVRGRGWGRRDGSGGGGGATGGGGRRPCTPAAGAFRALFLCVLVNLIEKAAREKGRQRMMVLGCRG